MLHELPRLFALPSGRGGGGYRPLSLEEKAARDDERRAQMKAGLTTHFESLAAELALGKTERLTNFLTCSANLIRLSPANQELIYSQRPDATFVATLPTWNREYNRKVKGENKATGEKQRAIWIWQPKPYQAKIEPEEEQPGEDPAAEAGREHHREEPKRRGRRGEVGIAFRPLPVYDLSQTEPIPWLPVKELPVFFTPLAGPEGMEEVNNRLVQAMEAEGINVSESIYTQGAEGYNLPNVVVTREGLAPTNKALVRIHEWTHNLVHRTPEGRCFPKGKKECHAEAVAFIVMKHLTGFESPFTRDYLLHYANKPEQLKAEMETILGAAQHIIEKVHALNPGEAPVHDLVELEGEG